MELTIDQALQRGIAAHKEGKLQDAENLYRSILNAQPAHPDANHNLGILAIGVGKVEAALPHLKTALESNPKVEQFWVSYIDALIRLGQIDTARQVLNRGEGSGLTGAKSAELKSRLVDVPVASAGGKAEVDGLIALYNQGKLEEGLVLGNALATQFPDNGMIPNILGVIYSGLGRYEEAVTSYNRTIELKPSYADAHNNLGNILKELDKYDEKFLKKINLRYIVLCKNLFISDINTAGIPDYKKRTLIIDIKFNEKYFKRSIHHEIFHIIDDSFKKSFNKKKWSNLNHKNFSYAECSTCTKSLDLNTYLNTNGFITEYSKSTASEDMAEIFSHLMVKKNLVFKNDEILKNKINFIKNSIYEIDKNFKF